MELLERAAQLGELVAAWEQARSGCGRLVVVSGEAGIGKTSLVEQFASTLRPGARVLWGACDSLSTPRPLGPLQDMVAALRGDVQRLLAAGAGRDALFAALHAALQSKPAIVVFEDLHWADEATLDLVKFLGRRLVRLPALLVLTHRDDEVGPGHPLRVALGDVPAQVVERIRLAALSERAVATLAAGAGRTPGDILSVTGGNPFFVTEVLRSGGATIPATVHDAVVARAARLDAEGRAVLELAAVVPNRVERWLLNAVLAPAAGVLERCERTGLVRRDADALAFRHELARRALEGALAAERAAELHALVLHALVEREPDALARLVHHAAAAGDTQAVLRHAPHAAQQAAQLGAHREAAAHYRTALRAAQSATDAERAELCERLSYECYLTGEIDAAVAARESALDLWRKVGSTEKEGDCRRWLSRLTWFEGRRTAAEAHAVEAVRILEPLPPGPALAMAWSNRAQLHMLADEIEPAIHLGRQAVELAEQLGATEILAHALNNVGTAELASGCEVGREKLERSLRLSIENDLQEHAARAFTNLASVSVKLRDYARGQRFLDAGIAYSVERDLDSWSQYMRAWRARLHFEQGRWEMAADDALAVAGNERGGVVSRIPALAALGHLRVRRGDPGAPEVLDEAWRLASGTAELQRLAPVAAACAEAAWWRGEPAEVVETTEAAYALACARRDPWAVGELGFWRWRAGALGALPEYAFEPWTAQVAGRWQDAASAFERLGCPYEQALALAGGDAGAQRAALAIFDRLGAAPAAESLRRTMRQQGVPHVPRGPRPSTRHSPLGLTARQSEILALLAEGLSNAAIAARLYISPKTVDHHVSAVLARLGVASRDEAARVACQNGEGAAPE